MTRVLGKLIQVVSWIVLLTSGLAALAGGWLYYGYSHMDCHPMFAQPAEGCGIMTAWAAEHTLIAGRVLLPYSEVVMKGPGLLFIVVGGTILASSFIQTVYRIVRRRRIRRIRG